VIKFIEKIEPDHQRVKQLLQLSQDSGHYTNEGPVKALLEDNLLSTLQLNEKRVYCCNSGTSAIYIAMYLAEQSYGKRMRWCIPSFTFPSCINGELFDVDVLDIDIQTATLTTSQCDEYDGIVLTNLFGTIVDIEAWESYSKSRGKILIYDNAASPLTRYKGKNICNYGDYAIGSFHHTKYLGFGEGGFLTLTKEEYTAAQRISAFGFGTYKEDYRRANIRASNFKLPDTAAAYILQHIERFSIKKYLELQSEVVEKIEAAGIRIFRGHNNGDTEIVFANIPCILDNEVQMKDLQGRSVEFKKYYYPLFPANENAFQLYNHIINVPLNKNVDLLVQEILRIK